MTLMESRNIWGRYPIPPHRTTEVTGDFWVMPPICDIGQDFKSTVFLTDQYGNDYKIKDVVFKGRRLKTTENEGTIQESIYAIRDSIEKQIVGVLKSEVYRYKNCGRRVGGLGSIQTNICGHTYAGIGPDSRKTDSPENQSIEKNEDEISITSDNAQALLKLHDKLIVEDEKERFYRALLKRVSRDTEYSDIGYFILFIMFELGKLDEVL